MSIGHALKRSLVALREAQHQQSLRKIRHWGLRRSQETKDLRRTLEQWRKVQRCSRELLCDVVEIPLANKELANTVLLDPRETLFALYMGWMRHQGHRYRIQDNPVRWAHFQRYLDLRPEHAPPARNDHAQPRHLWEVQSCKARGLGLRLPKADVYIDITWYRHLTETDQHALCGGMRSPLVCREVGKRDRVTLLLKHLDHLVQEANL